MSEQPAKPSDAASKASDTELSKEEFGHLSVEDDEGGTVDPGELAGTAGPDDDFVGDQPTAKKSDSSPS